MTAIPSTMMAWKKTKPEFGGFELVESTVPTPRSDEVLVKTHSTSICGTDIHIWKWDDWQLKMCQLELQLAMKPAVK